MDKNHKLNSAPSSHTSHIPSAESSIFRLGSLCTSKCLTPTSYHFNASFVTALRNCCGRLACLFTLANNLINMNISGLMSLSTFTVSALSLDNPLYASIFASFISAWVSGKIGFPQLPSALPCNPTSAFVRLTGGSGTTRG